MRAREKHGRLHRLYENPDGFFSSWPTIAHLALTFLLNSLQCPCIYVHVRMAGIPHTESSFPSVVEALDDPFRTWSLDWTAYLVLSSQGIGPDGSRQRGEGHRTRTYREQTWREQEIGLLN